MAIKTLIPVPKEEIGKDPMPFVWRDWFNKIRDNVGTISTAINTGGVFDYQNIPTNLRVVGVGVPTGGIGTEVAYDTLGTTGYVIAYDRSTSVYKPLIVGGSTLTLLTGGGNTALFLSGSGTANYLAIANSSTGVAPAIGSAGTDTNIDLTINAKGTGCIKVSTTGQFTSKNDPAAGIGVEIAYDTAGTTGVIVSYDRGGAVYKPLIIGTSALNLFADTVSIGKTTMTGDILWGKAIVALGGGAAPVFGTIGGTGPVGAGQNGWIRMLDNAAVPCWVPVWK